MHMPDKRALMCYQSVMCIARKWLEAGIINKDDYRKIDTIAADKFGVSVRSVWREIDLIRCPPDGNMPHNERGISDGTKH